MESKILTPQQWRDYELIDSGDGEKLERFGRFVTARPEPQAIWPKSLSAEQWRKMSNAYFRVDKGGDDKGEWFASREMPEQWNISYKNSKGLDIKFRLGMTSFKHVGIFPEQAANWDFIYEQTKRIGPNAKVLNLFAYTGGATMAARAGGAQTTHVDSIKQVVGWAKENMELSGLDNIRWIVDDALKFVKREVKRGSKYNGIILDPPAYGRGTNGERWVLDENLPEMLELCGQLLEDENSFLVLNLYSMGLSAMLARTAIHSFFGKVDGEQFGELYFQDKSQKCLPLGVYYRFWR